MSGAYEPPGYDDLATLMHTYTHTYNVISKHNMLYIILYTHVCTHSKQV